MIYFDSDMSKSTNTVVYFDQKMVIYIYACGKCRTQYMLPMEKSVTFTGACKHNLVSFFQPNRILRVELYRSFLYILSFQEKTLGDISFILETKIMTFMSVFFEKNIIKPTQVLSIICNTICLQFSLYRAPLQCLGLFLLISSCIFDFKCHSY